MKKQKQLLKEGDIVTNAINGFRRKIRSAQFEERSGIMKVMYSYYNEILSSDLRATGEFDQFSIGYCSQDHLIRWKGYK